MAKGLVEQMERRVTITQPATGGESPRIVAEGFACRVRLVGCRARLKFRSRVDGFVRSRFRIVSSVVSGCPGGVRFWIVCPDCERQRRDLFVIGDRVACRGCHHLTYMSVQTAHRRERIMMRVLKSGGLRQASDRDLIGLLRLIRLERELKEVESSTRKGRKHV